MILHNRSRNRTRQAFTLIELLVAIAVIAILVSLLLPAVQQAREASRRTECKNKLKQLTLGLHNYADVYAEKFPPLLVRNTSLPDGPERWGWFVRILPYVEQEPLYRKIDLGTYPLVESALPQARALLPINQCPSAPENRLVNSSRFVAGCEDIAETSYSALGTTGEPTSTEFLSGVGDGVLFRNSQTGFRDVTDGLSRTFLLCEVDVTVPVAGVECSSIREVGRAWAIPNLISTYKGISPDVEDGRDPVIFSWHPGGANFAFADGHVSFVSENVDQAVLDALTTRAGGEVVSGE